MSESAVASDKNPVSGSDVAPACANASHQLFPSQASFDVTESTSCDLCPASVSALQDRDAWRDGKTPASADFLSESAGVRNDKPDPVPDFPSSCANASNQLFSSKASFDVAESTSCDFSCVLRNSS